MTYVYRPWARLTNFIEMTEEEKASIFSAPEFLDFVEHSTKIIQRALNDNYDYVRDYTIGAETGVLVHVSYSYFLSADHCSATTRKDDASNGYASSTTNVMARTDLLQMSTGRQRSVPSIRRRD